MRLVGVLLKGAALGTLGWFAYSNLFISHNMPLPPAVPGAQHKIQKRAGPITYYVAGSGKPMLLIHSINAAASAYEIRPLFEHYSQTRRVYAPDLPGFGMSDRSQRDYTPRLYTNAILDMLEAIADDVGSEPIDAAALSLGSEFLARAASEQPERFRTLALITPTGFRKGERLYGQPDSIRGNPRLRQVFDFPLWSRPLFDLLNSRPSQRYFLARSFGSYEAVDPGLMEYDYLTAHQPGAQHAPYAFVSGTLFSGDIDYIYDALHLPVWLAYGTKGQFSNVQPEKVADRPNWTIQSFEAGGLPYFEKPEQFFAAYDAFLAQITE